MTHKRHSLPNFAATQDGQRAAMPAYSATMTFKLAQSTETSCRRPRGYNQVRKIIMGVKFNDIEVVRSQAQTAAA